MALIPPAYLMVKSILSPLRTMSIRAMKGELQSPVCTNFGEAIHLTRSLQSQTSCWDPRWEKREWNLSLQRAGIFRLQRYRSRNSSLAAIAWWVSFWIRWERQTFWRWWGLQAMGNPQSFEQVYSINWSWGNEYLRSDQWRIRLARPDDKPMENLALTFLEEGLSEVDRAGELGKAIGLLNKGSEGLTRLIQASSAPKTILVIDQFEEAFTRCDMI